jgi:hypothetical protein
MINSHRNYLFTAPESLIPNSCQTYTKSHSPGKFVTMVFSRHPRSEVSSGWCKCNNCSRTELLVVPDGLLAHTKRVECSFKCWHCGLRIILDDVEPVYPD